MLRQRSTRRAENDRTWPSMSVQGRFVLRILLALPLAAWAASVHAADEPSTAAAQAPVVVYATASTAEAVGEIARRFTAETGLRVEVSPGSSSKLAKQVVEGGPADVFLSADQANADLLSSRSLVVERRVLLRNRLVLVVPAGNPANVRTLGDLTRDEVRELALAVEGVPAGEYARQALRAAGVWEKVQHKVIGGEDVRAALAFVERGASGGIVYFTDTIGDRRVGVAASIDASLHRPIEYPLLLLERAAAKPTARSFFQYLASPAAAAIFRERGFTVAP